MKKIALFIALSLCAFALSAQTATTEIFKVFKETSDSEGNNDIILYKDSTFVVDGSIGKIGLHYNGGWRMTDTTLVLQVSYHCNGPVLLDKMEYRADNPDEIHVEIYNEKGMLCCYCILDRQGHRYPFEQKGAYVEEVREGRWARRLRVGMNGKSLPPVKMEPSNNHLILVLLEPVRNDSVYLGHRVIPLKNLEERGIDEYLKEMKRLQDLLDAYRASQQ